VPTQSSTFGIKSGVVKSSFYVQENTQSWILQVKHLLNLNHKLKTHFHRFPNLVNLLIGMQGSKTRASSTSLSMVLSKNDVRLVGLKALSPIQEYLLVLGINITFNLRHMAEQ